MQVNVTFRHMDPSDSVRDYAIEKVKRVEKYLQPPVEVHVILEVDKFMHRAEMNVTAKGVFMSAEDVTSDMYAAIDKAADKLERQVQRHKEKVKDH
jgi:putative sigma-54 modulation protein